MKTKKKIFSMLFASVMTAACLGAAVVVNGTGSAEESGGLPVSPDDLWITPASISLTEDCDVPDYMLYGDVCDLSAGGKVTTYTQDSSELKLEDWEKSGLKVTSRSAGKAMEFKNVVNIDDYTRDDVLFSFAPLPVSRGACNFRELDITLTDAEDESNSVLIQFVESDWIGYASRVAISGPGFGPLGYQYGDYAPTGYYGVHDLGLCDKYYISFAGYTRDSGNDETEHWRHRPFTLRYDAEDKCFWVDGHGELNLAVLKLDDSVAVGYGKEWKGFTSGRVKMSITTKNHSASSVDYLILNAFNTPMYGTSFAGTDTAAPELLLDTVTGEEGPIAKVGKAYPLYSYHCDDVVSGELDCDISVISPDGTQVAIENDAFVPETEGEYILVYTATDEAGNVAERRIRIEARTSLPAIGMDFNTSERVYRGTVGEIISVPEVTGFFGGSGGISLETNVEKLGSAETVDFENGTFRPLTAGSYLVSYTATDYLGNTATETVLYEVEHTSSLDELCGLKVQKLRRLFDGVPVKIPSPALLDYQTIPGVGTAFDVKITVAGKDGKGSTEVTDGAFTPSRETFGDTVTIFYELFRKGTSEALGKYSYEVEIYPHAEVSDPSFRSDFYFDYDPAQFHPVFNSPEESNYLRFYTNNYVTGESLGFNFVNPVNAEGFSLSFLVPGSATNFSELVISLRDSENPEIGFDLALSQMTDVPEPVRKKTAVVYDGVRYGMNGLFNSLSADGGEIASPTPLELKYSEGVITDFTGAEVLSVTKNFNGSKFEGFPSGKVYIDFTFKDVTGLAGIQISGICNQVFGARYSIGNLRGFTDVVSPLLFLDSDFPERFSFNQRVEIPFARAFDVLTPYMEVQVIVTAPDETEIFNQKIEEGMAFTISSYGEYRITYKTTDAGGNSLSREYEISAGDYIAPTIALDDYSDLSGTAGEEVSLPSAIVQDERDESPKLFIMVVSPNQKMQLLGEVTAENPLDSYVPQEKGEYRILYYAVDSNYNVTIETIRLIVK